MRIYCDFETETATMRQYKKYKVATPYYLLDEVKQLGDREKATFPICHCATFETSKGITTYVTRTFFEFVDKLEKWYKHDEVELFYHNLSFDFSIILWELKYKGYRHIQVESDNLIVDKPEEQKPYTFVIYGENTKTASGIIIQTPNIKYTLIDTTKHFQGSLLEWSKKTGCMIKGDYDFNNHKTGSNYSEIIEYCKRDTFVLMQCMEAKLLAYGFDKTPWTSSSASFKKYREYLNDAHGVEFEDIFPPLSEDARQMSHFAYVGAYVNVNPRYTGVILKNIGLDDIKSSYPYQIATKPMPYGEPVRDYIQGNYNEFFCYVRFEIKDNYIPHIRVHKNQRICAYYGYQANEIQYTRNQYPKEWEGYYVFNTPQLECLKRYYHYEIDIIESYSYNTTNIYFTDYIQKLYEDKEKEENAVAKMVQKIYLNSLYGKFGQDLSSRNKLYDFGEKPNFYTSQDTKGIYTPVAGATTAYGVLQLMERVNKNPNEFIFSDTDSVGSIIELGEYGYNLGDWSRVEKMPIESFKILGKKLYYYETKEDRTIKAVGLRNKNAISNIHNFKIGLIVPQIKFREYVGGQGATQTLYEIKERETRVF